MADPALGHPASRAHPGQPVAPVPISIAITVDACLCAFAGVIALTDAPWWIFAVALLPWIATITVYGRRAARKLGIRSNNETPRAWLIALGLPGGLAGVLATHTGRYAGLMITAVIVCAQIAERIIWARFRASKRPAERP